MLDKIDRDVLGVTTFGTWFTYGAVFLGKEGVYNDIYRTPSSQVTDLAKLQSQLKILRRAERVLVVLGMVQFVLNLLTYRKKDR